MTATDTGGTAIGRHIHTGNVDIWVEQKGQGPDVLLIGGLGDTVESWQFQLDGLPAAKPPASTAPPEIGRLARVRNRYE